MTVLDALQATLADEHAALYTYGVLGARTSQATSPALFETLTVRLPPPPRAPRPAAAHGRATPAANPSPPRWPTTSTARSCRPPQIERAAAELEAASVEVLPSLVAQSTGSRARVGAHRGDLVGGVAPPARRDRRDVAGSSRARPGPERPSSWAHRALTQGKRPAASAFGKVPRSLPKAEDADRHGVGQHHPVSPNLWGWWSDMHNHAFDPPDAKAGSTCMFLQRTKLQKCHAQDVAAAPPQEASSRRTTSGTSRRDVIVASGSPSVWPTWLAGIALCGTWIARIPAFWAPHTSSKSRSPT